MNGDDLQKYLDRLDITPREFAHCIGVDVRTVRRWLNGSPVPRLVGLYIALDPLKVYTLKLDNIKPVARNNHERSHPPRSR